jgi:hypothetical protein
MDITAADGAIFPRKNTIAAVNFLYEEPGKNYTRNSHYL